ncbi:hypothetical protein C8F01DRAFT_1361905 [Mycena amicta]|nr:hypothetical protein C8F01DRAFT_1361905 [Mycena amicta]
MDGRKLPLRILYTVNSAPQYILARSAVAVPIELIPPTTNATASSSHSTAAPPARYACTSLKTCLDTICRTSPELIQDRSRDYSVYLLDPLEADCAPTQPNSSQSSETSSADPTVAVGLGLMSWALAADESETVPVTGTLKASNAGKEMLELVFSLRSTLPMEKSSLSDTVRSWSLPSLPLPNCANSSSEGKRPTKYLTSRSAAKTRAAPPTKSDAFLSQDIYIGPVRQPLGRRPRSNTTVETSNKPHGTGVGADGDVTPSEPTTESSDKEKILDFLAALGAFSNNDEERNKALQGVLALMHGTEGAASPELINAMALLSTMGQSVPPSASTFSRSQSQPEGVALFNLHARRKSLSAEEIVPLNKENVNPTLFQRRVEPSKEGSNPLGPAWTDPSLSGQVLLPLSGSNQSVLRKRTWNELSEGLEQTDERAQRQRGQYYRQPEQFRPSQASLNNPISSPGPLASNARAAMAAPPRPVTSASSPLRALRRKPTPAWAITNTAMQPRLSEHALQRVQQKQQQKDQEEEEKKDAKRRTRRTRQSKTRLKDGKGPDRVVSGPSTPLRSATNVAPLPAPVAATSGFSLLVGQRTPQNVAVLHRNSPPKNAPCTPPRKRASTIATSGGPNSLFTPASWDTSGVLALQRTPVSPSCRKDPLDASPTPANAGADDLLDQELDSAFEELSSCPVASEDQGGTDEYDSDESDEEVLVPPKQHWEGLPPSSPPPPSSPYLLPAIPTEEDVDDGGFALLEADVASEPEPSASPEKSNGTYTVTELDNLLSMDMFSSDDPTANLFEQYMTGLDSDDSQTIKDWTLGTTQFDFTEFLNACQPILEAGQSGEGVDAAKVAGDVYSLFNGCAV